MLVSHVFHKGMTKRAAGFGEIYLFCEKPITPPQFLDGACAKGAHSGSSASSIRRFLSVLPLAKRGATNSYFDGNSTRPKSSYRYYRQAPSAERIDVQDHGHRLE
jgi:hypothetical protein